MEPLEIEYQNLLDEYKTFDYLNQDEFHPLIKILVSYIKPSFLFKSDILTPIHLGAATPTENSKDGNISPDDLKWLDENCEFKDDFEGGISHQNRRVGFLTGTYWVWKNYEQLGNPEYFGSFGYRRLFNPHVLDYLEKVDMIVPKARMIEKTYQDRLIDYLGKDFFDKVMAVISAKCGKEISNIQEYLNQNLIVFDELYIMKKSLFFQFCEWIFPILNNLLKLPADFSIDPLKLTTKDILFCKNESRDLAYVMEFLTGYFITCQKSKFNYVESDVILLYKDKQPNVFEVLRKRMKHGVTGQN